MTGAIKLSGIVLGSMPIGDYDRRLTILTAERGKISAFAKGARKPNSAFLACSQPFTYAEFSVFEGRSSCNITGFEKANYFEALRNDIDAMYYGMYFCELMDYLTREGNDEKEQMKLLYVSLLALSKGNIDKRLIRAVYELKAIALYGEAPVAFECALCRQNDGDRAGWYYSAAADGLICGACRHSEKSCRPYPICETTRYTLQYILSSRPEKLYSFSVSDDIRTELEHIAKSHILRHTDRTMKSLEIIENI